MTDSKRLKELQSAKTKENIKGALCMLPVFVGMSGAGICFVQWLSGQGDGYLKCSALCLVASFVLLGFYGGVMGNNCKDDAKKIQKEIDKMKVIMNQKSR